ncbi:MAG: LysE family transporter [Alphaproteobacteria bacterium]
MELFLAWLVIASVQLAATMSPGPAFVVAVRNAIAYDRKTGIATAFGLSLGVLAHVSFVLCGIALIVAQSVWLFSFIKYAGAAYLFYIGVKAIIASRKVKMPSIEINDDIQPAKLMISVRKAIVTGFLTNLLNPKAVVFFTAVFTQFINADTSFQVLALYGLTSVAIEFLWFAGVAIFLTHSRIRAVFLSYMRWVEGICGGLMVGLGIKLALSK